MRISSGAAATTAIKETRKCRKAHCCKFTILGMFIRRLLKFIVFWSETLLYKKR